MELRCGTDRERTSQKRLFLSFDDGPSPQYTELLLELLDSCRVKASFFVVAKFAEQNPAIMERMKRGGHLIGLHSGEHISAYLMTPRYAAQDFKKSMTIMNNLGISPKFYRPPWGHITKATRRLAEEYNLKIIGWDVMAGDWKALRSAGRIAAELWEQAAPNRIICLHDGRGRRGAPARTVEALRKLLPRWLSEGWQFDTIDKLYFTEEYFCEERSK